MVVAVGDVCLDGPGGPGEEPDEQHAAGGRGEEGAGQRVHTPHHQKVSRGSPTLLMFRVADPVHFRPDPDPDPAN